MKFKNKQKVIEAIDDCLLFIKERIEDKDKKRKTGRDTKEKKQLEPA